MLKLNHNSAISFSVSRSHKRLTDRLPLKVLGVEIHFRRDFYTYRGVGRRAKDRYQPGLSPRQKGFIRRNRKNLKIQCNLHSLTADSALHPNVHGAGVCRMSMPRPVDSQLRSDVMQVKVYCPQIIEIPSEYLPALAKRAADSLGDRAGEISATRGHLVRQAIQDGLLREFDALVGDDGTVDLVCDPGLEIPLELENKTLTLTELLEALQFKRAWADVKAGSEAA